MAQDGGYYTDPKTGQLMQGGTYRTPSNTNNQWVMGVNLNPNATTGGWSGGTLAANQPGAYKPQPYVDPMTLINPQYTQNNPYDSMAPMNMYQEFMKTGQLPQGESAQPKTAYNASDFADSQMGGK